MPVLTGSAAAAKIDAWVAARSPEHRTLAQAVRRFLVGLHPEIDERWAFGGPFVYCAGKIYAFMAVAPDGRFLIGLCHGAQLSDPHGLLAATDRQLIRHYYVSSEADLESEALLELFGQQTDLCLAAAKRNESVWKVEKRRRR